MMQQDDPRLAWQRLIECRLSDQGDSFQYLSQTIPIVNEIPRFTPDDSYSTGNFSRLRDDFPLLQFDSVNGTSDRLETMLDRTGWPAERFRDQLVLECGCGAGPDTEVLLKLGAKVVAVDIAGLDVAKRNLAAHHREVRFVQASIANLPFRRKHFDVVFCHRVLQHTPDPEQTLRHILQFVKPGGLIFIHSYARTFRQMVSWKYVLRPLTTRLKPESLLRLVSATTPPLFRLTCMLRRLPPQDYLGKLLFLAAHHTVPVRNHRFQKRFAALDDAAMIEYAIHDTFDSLSPKYDRPISASKMQEIAAGILERPFEVDRRHGITLLRSV